MINKKINIIIPPAWSGVYLNSARLLKSSLEDYQQEATIIEAGEIQGGGLFIVLGCNLLPDEVALKKPYIIYQLEPLGLSFCRRNRYKNKNYFSMQK